MSKIIDYILYGYDSSGGFWESLFSVNNIIYILVIFVVIPLVFKIILSLIDFVLYLFTGRSFVLINFLRYIKRRLFIFSRYTESVREDEDKRGPNPNLMSRSEVRWIIKRRKKRLDELTAFWYWTLADDVAAEFNLESPDFLYEDYSPSDEEKILEYIKKCTSVFQKPEILEEMYDYVSDAYLSLLKVDSRYDRSEIDEVNRYINSSDNLEEVFQILKSYYKLSGLLYVRKHDRKFLKLAAKLDLLRGN